MRIRSWLAVSVLLASRAFSGRAATAQSRPDTTSLVRAVADVIGDSILPRLSSGSRPYLGEPTTGFDAAVSSRLELAWDLTRMPARADTAEWLVTRGVTVLGDTAAVLIEVGTTRRPAAGIDTYVETTRYVFARTSSGWRFVRRAFVRGADLGAVRG